MNHFDTTEPASGPTAGYRPCVGTMLINPAGLVWIGRRFGKASHEGQPHWWQMPQGGIEPGEAPEVAALRELQEETGAHSAKIIAAVPGWLDYELPGALARKAWGGRHKGQSQKWFLLRFTGNDTEFNLSPPGHTPEFDAWRWTTPADMLEHIVPFKRGVYEAVLAAFHDHLAP